jgi:hypothetical protein
MSQLVIHDLPKSVELDRAARTAIHGGISFSWIRPYINAPQAGAASLSLVNITNNFISNDYTLIEQNPTNIFVNNGAGNTGSIVNNITATPFLAASPTLLSRDA